MANYTASTVGLYNAGGSGDNLASNNTIKGIEKVWLDTFVTTAAVTTSDTICIGYVPANCRIVGVEVLLPITFAPTTAAINVGMSYSTACLISNSTAYVGASNNKATMNVNTGMGFNPTSSTSTVSGGTVILNAVQGVYLSLNAANATSTSATITSIIRYV